MADKISYLEMKFTELEIHPDLISAAIEAGFEELTPIQEQCLEPALEGNDIAGIAQTCTGKTVAFLLPILNKILNEKPENPAALIVAPTRELCLQIKEEAEKLTAKSPVKVTAIYGGEGYKKQEAELAAEPHLIVATPGRLIDYLKQKKVKTEALKFLVLDEADRMFDMGFIRDVRYIMKHAPEGTQTMLFSATLSYYVMRLASDFMKDPIEIRIESDSVAVDKIDQSLLHLGREEKFPYLLNLILNEDNIRAIVFTNTRHMVQKLSDRLQKYGIGAVGISSLLDQKKRIKLLKDFKLGKYNVLVATDVASRGLDIDDITHVYNYDLPQDAESYVHRIGRTARAGRSGVSVAFSSEDDYDNLPRIQRYLKVKIPTGEIIEEYLKMPKGNFKPFREPGVSRDDNGDESMDNAPQESGGQRKTGNRRRRRPRGKDGNREQGRSRDQQSQKPRQGGERKDSRQDGKAASGTSASSVRAMDREAILSGVNTVAGGRAPEDVHESASREAANQNRRRKKSGGKKRGREGDREERKDGDRRSDSRRKSSNRRRDGRGRDRDRDNDQRGARGDQRRRDDRQRERQKKQEKKGLLGKILSIFKK